MDWYGFYSIAGQKKMQSQSSNIDLDRDFSNVFTFTDFYDDIGIPQQDDPFYHLLNIADDGNHDADGNVPNFDYSLESQPVVEITKSLNVPFSVPLAEGSLSTFTQDANDLFNNTKVEEHGGDLSLQGASFANMTTNHEHVTNQAAMTIQHSCVTSTTGQHKVKMEEENDESTILIEPSVETLEASSPVSPDIITVPFSPKRIMLLNGDFTCHPPMPNGPQVRIVAKTIAYVCNDKYIERVQNALIVSYDKIKRMIPLNTNNHTIVPMQHVFQKYMAFSLPNGYTVPDFQHMQGINNWKYFKNTCQPLDKLPMRFQGFHANFYEPIIKRTKERENGSTIREALCPYCPVDFTNLSRCFFNTDGCLYQHHVSRSHGVWNRGYEMPPPLVYESGFRKHKGICPLCTKDLGIVKLGQPGPIIQGDIVYNSFITYHKHIIRNHNIKKKGRSPVLLKMDKEWFEGVNVHEMKYESQICCL